MVLHRSLGRLVILAMVACAASADVMAQRQQAQLLAAQPQPVVVQPLVHDPLSPFTADEVRAFLGEAAKADQIGDVMQRCLHFPDPPGSHWSREGLEAYCHYRLQSTIGFAELKDLVNSGHAAEVDRRLADWSKDSIHHPEAFWRFLNANFFAPRPEARDVLEAWKQQSPQSALAYAASGFTFVRSAWRVRGGKFASDTPQERFDGMSQLLARADGDLRRAVKLDPRLAVGYAALMDMAMLESDRQLMVSAMKDGIAADPTSFPVLDSFAMITEPRWFGSLEAQARLMALIDKQSSKQPLLLVVRTSVLMDQADLVSCDCNLPEQRAAYRTVFDQVGTGSSLIGAGANALDNKQYEVATVYLAEALRFDPNDAVTRGNLRTAMAGIDPSLTPRWPGLVDR